MSDSSAPIDPATPAGSTAGERWRCTECTQIWLESEIVVVEDPGSDELWWVCPCCRTPENFRKVCDYPGCDDEVTCGWPSQAGYRRTCFKHWDQSPASPPAHLEGSNGADETTWPPCAIEQVNHE